MGKTELIIFLVAALIVYVESCSNSEDCPKGLYCLHFSLNSHHALLTPIAIPLSTAIVAPMDIVLSVKTVNVILLTLIYMRIFS